MGLMMCVDGLSNARVHSLVSTTRSELVLHEICENGCRGVKPRDILLVVAG